MTTQNNYDDHYDADASVVGHPYASETSDAQETPEASITSAPAEESSTANADVEESVSSAAAAEQPQDALQTSTQQDVPSNDEAETTATEEVPVVAAPAAITEDQQEQPEHNTALPQSQTEESAVAEAVSVEPLLVTDTQAATPAAFSTETEAVAHPAEGQDSDQQQAADMTPAVQASEESHQVQEGQEEQPVAEIAAPEEVRPFTSFFEEFRQAEEARHELQVEALSLFAAAQSADAPQLLASNDNEHVLADSSAVQETFDATTPTSTEEVFSTEAEAAIPIFGATTDEAQKAGQDTAQQAQTPTTPVAPIVPKERPVSPLLRPATRLRLPRHGLIRHRDEPVPAVAQAAPTEPVAIDQAKGSESTSAPEQPRPTRRYRFDNRSSAAAAATHSAQTPAQPRAEEGRALAGTKPENGHNGNNNADIAKQTNNTSVTNATSTPTADSQTNKQPETQDQVTTENSTSGVTASSHISEQDRRRRHGQERPREKEQTMTPATPVAIALEATNNQGTTSSTAAASANPATVADIAALVEPEQPTTEVAPEDMPPLEYSDLQKANPRRRRRHRTTTTAPVIGPLPAPLPVQAQMPVAPVVPVVAAVPQPLPQPQPLAQPTKVLPAAVAESGNGQVLSPVTTGMAPRTIGNPQYSIVSGYTVNQMNQGNESSGPFMGPEPSPARGSTITRDGRTARAESQRSHVYPARPTEAAIPSTSVHQLASVLSQAIQTQTDRMVAELRRANQGPTNVSVSLPPMPSSERVGVFVDVANLLYSARTTRIAVDFGKLLDFLRGNRRLIRAHAYCPTSPQAGDEQMFLQAVKGLGYRITTKNYKTFSSGAKKADLDLDLCMDVVRIVDGGAVDCIVLVSGDSDFMPMLDYCSDHGVRVEVAAFDEAMSATLRQSCDLFINLSLLEEIRS